MLSFGHVSTRAQVTPAEYLRMTFERDAELVRGEIVERSMPDYLHSTVQYLLLMLFGELARKYPVLARPELRLQLARTTFRIPDISVFTAKPDLAVPKTPPLLVIEILSKDDRHSDLMEKLEEYRQWGVPNIWVIDPKLRRFSDYGDYGLRLASSLSLPDYSFELTPSQLFADL
jgi:Uma2 family endonuclease